jgi:uncharacterized membrane protein
MSKKLLIYGLAFGSAAAALSYIYMVNIAGSKQLWLHLISIFGEFLIIPGVAIYMFLKSLKQSNPEEFLLGKSIFLGFILSVIIASSVSLFYSYMAQFNPELINGFIALKIEQLKQNTSVSKLTAKELEENITAIRESYSTAGQFRYQLYLGAARGLFLSAVIAYMMKAKSNRS